MTRHTFTCIDGHTCGNPVRMVIEGGPELTGATMIERRRHFLNEFDWIRTALMYEPRGHEVMSGSILYPATRDDCDIGVLFIEVSGCLPMCGHGTIGTVTMAVERGLIAPKTPGLLRLDTPAGVVEASFTHDEEGVDEVRIRNVPAFLYGTGYSVDIDGLGPIACDVAYGGNFYAIIEPQDGYHDMSDLSPLDIQRLSPLVRQALNDKYSFVHPEEPQINALTHVMWTGVPTTAEAHARNAVFYGDKAIDRSPCGTGTSARMAQLAARGDLSVGEEFIHESIIGTLFSGRVEQATAVGEGKDERAAIVPSIAGWARITGDNTIYVDSRDPLAHGFLVV